MGNCQRRYTTNINVTTLPQRPDEQQQELSQQQPPASQQQQDQVVGTQAQENWARLFQGASSRQDPERITAFRRRLWSALGRYLQRLTVAQRGTERVRQLRRRWALLGHALRR